MASNVYNLTGASSDYGWGVTEDGKSVIVWKGSWFAFYAFGSTVNFDNGDLNIGATGSLDFASTSLPTDTSISLAGAHTDYGYGATADGKSFIVWKGSWFKFNSFGSKITFADGTLNIGSTGQSDFTAGTSGPVDTGVTLAGAHSDYGYGATADGKSFIVWKGSWFAFYSFGSKITFADGTLNIGATGQSNFVAGSTSTISHYTIVGNIADYGWGVTEDGKSFIVWCGSWFKFYPFDSVIQFNDGTLEVSSSGGCTCNNTGNQAPHANNDVASLIAGSSKIINVLGNDTDANGDPLHVQSVTQPAHGTVTINADGTVTYVPVAGYTGPDSFTYTINDGHGGTSTATVNCTVNPAANIPPVANNDAATILAGTPKIINVLSNDTDANGDPLRVQSVTQPAHGTVTINPDGTVTYVPVAGYSGPDSFTYTITDGHGGTSTATVNCTVNPAANTPPDAVNDSSDVVQGTPKVLNVLSNDTDANGDPLRVQSVTQPLHGTATINPDGTVTYIPTAGYTGPDSFTYTINDGKGGTDTATVTLTVKPPVNTNTAPDAVNDAVDAVIGTPKVINVLSNDTDANGDPLRVQSITQPLNGTATINPDGTVTYVPNPGYVGNDIFTYTINDGKGGTDTATVTIAVKPPANIAPDAINDASDVILNTAKIINVLSNDTDANGDPLRVQSVTQGLNGTASINPDGTVTYTPNAGFTGNDVFTYTINDGKGGTDTATVTVNVKPPANTPPVANNDASDAIVGVPKLINVLGNDTDANGDVLHVQSIGQPAHGTTSLNPDGTVTYTATSGYTGPDTFTYTINDGHGGTSTATVAVTVKPVPNDAPVAVNDVNSGLTASPITGNVLSNDTDANGDTLNASLVTGPAHGTLTLNPNGTYIYKSVAGYVGTDTFTYQASDGKGGLANAVATITVNKPPVDYKVTIDSSTTNNAVDSIVENHDKYYHVTLDKAVTVDTYVTVQIMNGTAHQTDGTGYHELWAYQGDPRGGEFGNILDANTHTQYYVANQAQLDMLKQLNAFNPAGDGIGLPQSADQIIVGVDNLIYDYIVKDTLGNVVSHNGTNMSTFQVLVKAGQTTSDYFSIHANSEIDYYGGTARDLFGIASGYETESNETFKLTATAVSGGTINSPATTTVTIIDIGANSRSPIAIDLNHDGHIGVTGETSSHDKSDVTKIGHTVQFDIDADGHMDTIEWFNGSGDGILVDMTKINMGKLGQVGALDGSALFGDQGGKFANGYSKLALLDANHDGQLTAAELDHLGVWIDNGDGILQEGELKSLADAHIASISTNMNLVKDATGHNLMQSFATDTDGHSLLTEDVWFMADHANVVNPVDEAHLLAA